MDLQRRTEEGGKDSEIISDIKALGNAMQIAENREQRAMHKIKWMKFIAGILFNRLPKQVVTGLELRLLVVLEMSDVNLLRIPSALGSAIRLRELNVSYNGLGLGPKTDNQWQWLFGREITKSLQVLNMSRNHLTEIPECMWILRALTKLVLEGNRLVTLPRKINASMTLRYLSVENNDLIQLPEGVFRCPLEYFEFSGNPELYRNILRDFLQPDLTIYPLWNRCWQPRSLFDYADRCIITNKINYSGLPERLVAQLDGAVRCYCGFQSRDESQYQVLDCFIYWRSFPMNIHSNRHRDTLYVECAVCSEECRNELNWHVNKKYRPLWYDPPTLMK